MMYVAAIVPVCVILYLSYPTYQAYSHRPLISNVKSMHSHTYFRPAMRAQHLLINTSHAPPLILIPTTRILL